MNDNGVPAVAALDMTILEVLTLFAPHFAGESWRPWRVFLSALFALPIAPDDAELFTDCTQRTTPPTLPVREAWVVVGRRGGKSRIAALVAVYAACFRDYTRLAPGEVATIAIIAADRKQARVCLRYCRALLDHLATLPIDVPRLISNKRESFELDNRVVIEVHTASFRLTRGYTLAAVVCDEISFWPTENAAEPDIEILQALRPGLATLPGALLLCISSPYARRGALWDAYRRHYGQDGDPVLVWQAGTPTMNANVDARVIADAYEADEASAAAEYGAQFRRDIEAYVSREALDACVIPGRRELPPAAGVRYFGFVDPSGGSQDSMTLAIAHIDHPSTAGVPLDAAEAARYRAAGLPPPDNLPRHGSGAGRILLDCVRERRPPFSPAAVVADFARTLATYNITHVVGDRWGGEFVREPFRLAGVSYVLSEHPKSDLYRDMLPLITSQRVELLDDRRLFSQLTSLERRTSRAGKDSIDHAPGAHDDLANAVAGVLVLAEERGRRREMRTVRLVGL